MAEGTSTLTGLVADDTDILVLLCLDSKATTRNLYLRPEPRYGMKKEPRCWDISVLKSTLGTQVCKDILFVHAILGRDTTSHIYGFGKGAALKLIRTNKFFQTQAKIFGDARSTKADIVSAGEKAIVCLYKGKSDHKLDVLRFQRFQEKVSCSKVFVKPEVLPPISAAAAFHSQRVFLQVHEWQGNQMQPLDWGWCEKNGEFAPVPTDKVAAPKDLIKIVRCNCKSGCSNRKCTCKANGLECTNGCGVCRGVCKNVSVVLEESVDNCLPDD